MNEQRSPLTGLLLSQPAPVQPGGTRYYAGDTLGPWYGSRDLPFRGDNIPKPGEQALQSVQIGGKNLDNYERECLLALAASKVWRSNQQKRPFVYLATADDRANDLPHTAHQEIILEDLWAEASHLTFTDKANETLRNFALLRAPMGSELRIAFRNPPLVELPEPKPGADAKVAAFSLKGFVYGAINGERNAIIESLIDDGLVKTLGICSYQAFSQPEMVMGASTLRVTSAGYKRIDQLKSGDVDLTKNAFLVCKFDTFMDRIYRLVYEPTGRHPDLGCSIERIKDRNDHHVDRIDDRILHDIREATVVIVDLTVADGKPFNLAFEAGYGLALGKPIVWALRRPSDKLDLPFDIQSHNILLWEEDKLGEFGESLRYRILAALEKAREKA